MSTCYAVLCYVVLCCVLCVMLTCNVLHTMLNFFVFLLSACSDIKVSNHLWSLEQRLSNQKDVFQSLHSSVPQVQGNTPISYDKILKVGYPSALMAAAFMILSTEPTQIFVLC